MRQCVEYAKPAERAFPSRTTFLLYPRSYYGGPKLPTTTANSTSNKSKWETNKSKQRINKSKWTTNNKNKWEVERIASWICFCCRLICFCCYLAVTATKATEVHKCHQSHSVGSRPWTAISTTPNQHSLKVPLITPDFSDFVYYIWENLSVGTVTVHLGDSALCSVYIV